MIDWMSIVDETKNYRWPRKGDRLIRRGQSWPSGEFSDDGTSRHVHIWDGSMQTGAILIGICEEDNYQSHSLIYPILSNYRHAIELAMKWVIKQYGRYSTLVIDDFEHHNLWKLWSMCRQIIIEVGSEDEAMPVVEQIIKDFHDLDKSGQIFRYPRSKGGTVVRLPDFPIDLSNIRDVMQGVAHFFDGVDGQLDAHSSAAEH